MPNPKQPPHVLTPSAFAYYYEYDRRISKRQKRRRRGKARLNIGYHANGVPSRFARNYAMPSYFDVATQTTFLQMNKQPNIFDRLADGTL